MQAFLKKHQQKLSMTFGILFLILGIVLKILNQPPEVSKEERIALKNIARMEARVNKSSSSGSQKAPSSSGFSAVTPKEKEDYAFIMMIVLGMGFLGFSFYNSKKR
jgi:hypothetical protein